MSHIPNKTLMIVRMTSPGETRLLSHSTLLRRDIHTGEYLLVKQYFNLGLDLMGVPSCALYDTVRSPLSRESFYLSKEGQILWSLPSPKSLAFSLPSSTAVYTTVTANADRDFWIRNKVSPDLVMFWVCICIAMTWGLVFVWHCLHQSFSPLYFPWGQVEQVEREHILALSFSLSFFFEPDQE